MKPAVFLMCMHLNALVDTKAVMSDKNHFSPGHFQVVLGEFASGFPGYLLSREPCKRNKCRNDRLSLLELKITKTCCGSGERLHLDEIKVYWLNLLTVRFVLNV